jgi:general secretion pathway protein D
MVQTPPPAQVQRAVGSGSVGSGSVISFNFDDADVFSVIQTIFGDVLRVNYVVDPKVKGRVTFRSVAPINRDQVLPIMEVILRLNGIGVVEDQGLYRIVSLGEVAREPSPISFGSDAGQIPVTGKSIIHVVPITYLQSTEVIKLITPFLSAGAVVLDVPKSNQVVIVDTDASVRRILRLIQAFDNETQKKKRAQVFVYPVQNGKAKDVANILQQMFLGARASSSTSSTTATRTTGAMQPPGPQTTPSPLPQPQISQVGKDVGGEALVSDITRIYADDITNSIIVLATPEDYATIKSAVVQLDIVPRQVLIEGLVASVNLKDSFSLGVAYAARAKITFGNTHINSVAGFNANAFNNSASSSTGGSTGASTGTTLPALSPPQTTAGFNWIGVETGGDFAFFVNALASNSGSKTLAAPHILVSDNREAHIQVGQQVPIVTSSTINPGGTVSGTIATNTVQYKDIGIILKIKPQVNDSGLVALEISQEISTFDTIDLGGGQKDIIINKTEAATNLVVQDGQTIIIGGLIREDRTRAQAGIPFFSRIPVLGYLFGGKDTSVSRNEVIILLTPHVVKNAKEARAVTSEYIDSITSPRAGKDGLKKDEFLLDTVQMRKGTGEPTTNGAVAKEPPPPPGQETPAK